MQKESLYQYVIWIDSIGDRFVCVSHVASCVCVVCVYVCVCVCVCVWSTHVCTYVCTYVCASTHVRIFV
jgi:hypothetical protein